MKHLSTRKGSKVYQIKAHLWHILHIHIHPSLNKYNLYDTVWSSISFDDVKCKYSKFNGSKLNNTQKSGRLLGEIMLIHNYVLVIQAFSDFMRYFINSPYVIKMKNSIKHKSIWKLMI